MAEIIGLNAGAMGRVKQHYEEKLAEKDMVIGELRRVYEDARTQVEAMHGVNELLRMQVASLTTILTTLSEQVSLAQRNVADLKQHLPEMKNPG